MLLEFGSVGGLAAAILIYATFDDIAERFPFTRRCRPYYRQRPQPPAWFCAAVAAYAAAWVVTFPDIGVALNTLQRLVWISTFVELCHYVPLPAADHRDMLRTRSFIRQRVVISPMIAAIGVSFGGPSWTAEWAQLFAAISLCMFAFLCGHRYLHELVIALALGAAAGDAAVEKIIAGGGAGGR